METIRCDRNISYLLFSVLSGSFILDLLCLFMSLISRVYSAKGLFYCKKSFCFQINSESNSLTHFCKSLGIYKRYRSTLLSCIDFLFNLTTQLLLNAVKGFTFSTFILKWLQRWIDKAGQWSARQLISHMKHTRLESLSL